MLELPAVVKNVAIDPSLRPLDVRVYLVASQLLDDRAFKELYLVSISLPIGTARTNAHRSMRRLCEQGYIERGPRGPRGVVTYRLTPYLVALG